MNPSIERARINDGPDVLRLLAEQHLPLDGISELLDSTVVARLDGQLVGSAALEQYPDGVLLRSVVVTSERQNSGIGRELIAAALRMAEDLRAPAVYLLTTTAERYFPRFGFERIDRCDVPQTVRNSVEFTSACPLSAAVMRKRL